MRAKTTLILFPLVISMLGLILGIELFFPSTRELLEMKRGPLRFDKNKITQIDIDSSGGDGVSRDWGRTAEDHQESLGLQ